MPTFDLRKAITHLQLNLNHERASRKGAGSATADLETLKMQLETRSFVDGLVAPRPWARMEVSPQSQEADTSGG